MSPLLSLTLASSAFVGTHILMSHPLRAPMVRALGNFGFMTAYSLVSALMVWWMIAAFLAAPAGDLPSTGTVGWIVATLLTIPAAVLLGGSFIGNPAMPQPGAADRAATHEPTGVFQVTRHPMMWGVGLWGIAHVALWWDWRTNIFAGSLVVLALLGSHLQDRKKRRLTGDSWAAWESRTSFWPRWRAFASVGISWWAVGLALWLGLSWGHIPIGGIAAGVWRWIG